MRKIFSILIFLFLIEATANAEVNCPSSSEITGAWQRLRTDFEGKMHSILTQEMKFKVEQSIIPEQIHFDLRPHIDSQGSLICAYYESGGCNGVPFYVVNMGPPKIEDIKKQNPK